MRYLFTIHTFRDYIFDRHNNYCNQKYDGKLPYSFHLRCAREQGFKFSHLLQPDEWRKYIHAAILGHDCLEGDARMTYNDLVNLLRRCGTKDEDAIKIAEIVYCVTDEKGRNRAERKNEKYYKELRENKLAVFVKLADIAANTLYSKLTGSSMYEKYKKEFPIFKEKVYTTEYAPFFDYIENL